MRVERLAMPLHVHVEVPAQPARAAAGLNHRVLVAKMQTHAREHASSGDGHASHVSHTPHTHAARHQHEPSDPSIVVVPDPAPEAKIFKPTGLNFDVVPATARVSTAPRRNHPDEQRPLKRFRTRSIAPPQRPPR
jgi:hypothetical protein